MDINNLVVSRSNFVIQKKHQDTNDGEIFERDITTIGGKNYFDEHQRPVYNSGNFIITTSNDTPSRRPIQEIVWDTAPDGSDNWNLDSVADMTEEEDSSISIELNPDVYDLRNFAYYGSCVELMRGSINHIVNTFPGEIYGTDKKLTIYDKKTDSYLTIGKNTEFFIDNPFNINLHEEGVEELIPNREIDYLKYFNYGEIYKNYEYYKDSNTLNGDPIKNVSFHPFTSKNDPPCFVPFEQMGELSITTENNVTISISVYRGELNSVIYMSSHSNGWHIRPKKEYYTQFKSNLSLFEKTLMNDNTTPKYSPKFDVYRENEYGFEVQLQTFSFPLADGGYNLGILSPSYSTFIGKLTDVANFYDEHFSDNLYRSMTHEAIKNFDWSYKRNFSEGEEDEYLDGGGRIQKFIRLVGREFDEIKLYIDGISNANNISYNKENNLPDYFLTDMVENNGWDYKHVIPFTLDSSNKFINVEENIIPYNNEITTDIDCYALEPIRTYTSLDEWTPSNINNLFSRLLILNSRYIWRKKGTKDGIDAVLSLFGLKNKEWVDKINERNEKVGKNNPNDVDCPCDISFLSGYSIIDINDWDYEIKEHISKIENPIDADEQLLSINSTYKLISYEEDLNTANTPTDWRGLMVKEKDGKLYPYFGKDIVYDGNPYYQMNGGWLHKDCFFDENNNLINGEMFTETINRVKVVENLQKLVSIPYNMLKDGDIYYVNNLADDFIVIGDRVYNLTKYPVELTKNQSEQWYYFEVDVVNESCVIGDSIYRGSLSFKTPALLNDETDENYIDSVKPLRVYPNGSYVKIFVEPNGNLLLSDAESSKVTATAILNSGTKLTKGVTNYFILNGKDNSYNISLYGKTKGDSKPLGWIQLTEDSDEYKKIMLMNDYYYGNNPHTATLQNDLGFAYMDYFIHLFRYSYDNDLFNWNGILNTNYCADEEEEKELRDKIKNFGFSELVDSDNLCKYKHENDEKNKIHIVHDDELEESYKVINTKLIEIEFRNTKSNLSKLKYIDSVILPYLSQVLPSSLIIQVKYL